MRPILILMLLLLIPSVLAVGITPASQNIEYQSGVADGRIKVIGDGEILLSSSDERLEFDRNYVNGDTVVNFRIDMRNFDPGATPITITARQITQGGMIDSEVAVNAKVVVEREVSGKFATLEVFPPKEGASAFYVRVHNKGRDRIVEAQAFIDIDSGDLTERFSSETVGLAPGTSTLLEVPVRLDAGAYSYDASVTYDGEIVRRDGEFVLGKPDVVYTGFYARDFSLGEINEFVITLENRFNREVLADVSVELIQGESIDRFSQSVLLEASKERVLSTYIDTSRAEVGPATLAVELEYDGSRKVREQPITLETDEVLISGQVTGSSGSNVNVVLLLVLLGVLLNVGLVFLLLRRQKKD